MMTNGQGSGVQYWRALTIAGSDSGGGAGLQADIKTFSALGCYAMSVVTAITAQNTVSVDRVFPLPDALVADQIRSVISDMGVDVIKIGMLHTPSIVKSIVETLLEMGIFGAVPVVLDTVMMAKSGAPLLQPEAVDALVSLLFPHTSLLTPNLPEAKHLLGRDIRSPDEMVKAAEDLTKLGPQAVVLKGGHLDDNMSNDCLYIGEGPNAGAHWFHAERIQTQNVHGTGCTYSAAIAALLAQGVPLVQAVDRAKVYLTHAIRAGAQMSLGKGHGPVHHFHTFWDSAEHDKRTARAWIKPFAV